MKPIPPSSPPPPGVPKNRPAPNEVAADPKEEAVARRNFFIEAIAFVIGGLVVAVPAAVAAVFFFNPLLRKSRRLPGGAGSDDARRDAEGFLRVTSLASLPAGGRPQIFTVYDDLVDAWNKFVDQPVGRVYLRKRPDGTVTAFNVRCPHLGCAVDYRPAENDYFCPCHLSAFNLDGQKENEIPPRGMDSLDVKIKNGSEVWVHYQVFKAATPDKIPVGA